MKISHFSLYILLVGSGLLTSIVFGQTYEVVDLGIPGGNASTAYDIDDSDQIVGNSATANGNFRPFLRENGTMMDL